MYVCTNDSATRRLGTFSRIFLDFFLLSRVPEALFADFYILFVENNILTIVTYIYYIYF